jgi:hypothetical protein
MRQIVGKVEATARRGQKLLITIRANTGEFMGIELPLEEAKAFYEQLTTTMHTDLAAWKE